MIIPAASTVIRSIVPVRSARRTWAARGQAGGVSQAVGRERLEVVLAHDEEGAGIGAGVAQKAVERGIAERLELEAAGEDAAEVAHRALHRVRPGQGVDEPVERAGGGADLVGRVDRQRAGLRVAAAPVLREDRRGAPRPYPSGRRAAAAGGRRRDGPGRSFHGADDEAGRDRRGKEERGEDPLGREPEEEAERWEDEPDEEPEPRHPDREVDEDLGGEARHGALPVARQSPRTMRRPATRGHGAMVRVGPVRSGRGAGRRGRGRGRGQGRMISACDAGTAGATTRSTTSCRRRERPPSTGWSGRRGHRATPRWRRSWQPCHRRACRGTGSWPTTPRCGSGTPAARASRTGWRCGTGRLDAVPDGVAMPW